MNQNTTTRLDPLTNVMPYELLRVANKLMEHGQMEWYWNEVPVPKRPVGRVRFEVARQVATFAVPLMGLAFAAHTYGLRGALFAAPVAWLAGYLLHKQLDKAIAKKQYRDHETDRGRYNAVKWLSAQMGMAPEEITLDIIRKMDKDFLIVDRIHKQLEAKQAADKKAAAAAAAARNPRRRNSGSSFGADVGTAGVAGVVATEVADTQWSDDAEPFDHFGAVNPANGMPMLSGTGIDVMGNPFGTDHSM